MGLTSRPYPKLTDALVPPSEAGGAGAFPFLELFDGGAGWQFKKEIEVTQRERRGSMIEAKPNRTTERLPAPDGLPKTGNLCHNLGVTTQAPQSAKSEQKPDRSLWLSALQFAETAEENDPLSLARFLDQLAHDAQNFVAQFGVKRARGFVEQHHLRFHG